MNEELSEMKEDHRRLKIQSDLPIRTVGIETERERTNYSDLPPQNYIHVWWARRPTPATRLAILGSVLPDSIDDDSLLQWMGINPRNIAEGLGIAEHVRQKNLTEDDRDGLVYEHYGYRKSYKNLPSENEFTKLHDAVRSAWNGELPTILDATAGGGSIPFESMRYQFPTIANELNPVASVLLNAVLIHPRSGDDLSDDIRKWGERINSRVREELDEYFHSREGEITLEYLWAHTIACPDCGLELPLSPDWWLEKESSKNGVAARPHINGQDVDFEIVELPGEVTSSEFNPTNGTVSRGKAVCLNCSVTIGSDEVKQQIKSGGLNDQLYAIHYKSESKGKNREFRAPEESDFESIKSARNTAENDIDISSLLTEEIPYGEETARLDPLGFSEWSDMYSDRQLVTHYAYLKAYEDLKSDITTEYDEGDAKAILTFLSLAADKSLNYNSRFSSWISSRASIRSVFERHDFAFKWSYAESNLLAEGLGYDWVLDSIVEVYEELRELSGHSKSEVNIYQDDASSLPIDDGEIDAVVLDPPYYDNVMYAELSDFFYVWMKRYLGDIYPGYFDSELAPKSNEAVANPSKFEHLGSGDKSKRELAKDDYEQKMTDIFREMHRVMDENGIFTLMFTHKKTEAWDTLTKALIESGFIVTSTHPISTERAQSLHQSGKNAAQSTILLSSEKRMDEGENPTLWSDIRRQTQQVAREKARQLDRKDVDFAKVDIILASFGPTLEVFTRNYPVLDDEGAEVRPQVALDEARSAVRDYLIDQYLNEGVRDVDPITEWYIMALLVFQAQRFPYDEANRLGKGVGVEVDDIKRSQRLWRKKGNDIVLRPHDQRVQTPADKEKSRSTKPIDPDAITFDTDLDKVHAVMYVYDTLGLVDTEKYIKDRGLDSDPAFRATYEALLQVLPPTHDDWEILRDMALTDVGELVDLDVDNETFQRADQENQQDKLSNY